MYHIIKGYEEQRKLCSGKTGTGLLFFLKKRRGIIADSLLISILVTAIRFT